MIEGMIDSHRQKKAARARAERARARRATAVRVIVAVLIIAGVGTGGVFLVKMLFFSKPSAVTEIATIVETAPDVVPVTETPEQKTQTTVTASESEPVAKTGFFHKVGEFFAGIGRAIKWFFIMVWNAIKTFFINVGAFFAGIFGKLISFVKGIFRKNGG
ncbi:MAG: hypothetical protein LBT04_00215 [Prevotellaceae bacterium]|jgi:hypothetical protein|nr:hypothetical protein [Prevotellaceae bacterium]